ncbi:hypothetical protein Cfor_03946 [Coptotermes formosanus]|uniref:Uncharacterized protein n=1 Tax=Coptotermes formosanus TaxID=36987 RepID=A0A6L2PTE7_COPFO|nr:hypothetical protein Cfor_03946 [Coptotermes formosanus]
MALASMEVVFHIWHEELKQCLQIENTTVVLTSHREEQDVTDLSSLSEHKMFIKISIVGLVAVISVCTFLLSCTAYGCCSCTRMCTLTLPRTLIHINPYGAKTKRKLNVMIAGINQTGPQFLAYCSVLIN